MTKRKKIPSSEGYHPTGLKGKDIGLFYRDLKRAKDAEEAANIAQTYEEKAASNVGNVSGLTKKQRRVQHVLQQQLLKQQKKQQKIQQKKQQTIVSHKYYVLSFNIFSYR